MSTITADEDYRGTRVVVKHYMGHTMGYARVPADHPMHGKGYDDSPAVDVISVHGGLTFAGELFAGEWFLGFDTAHYGDGAWTTAQTMDETRALADQIIDYAA